MPMQDALLSIPPGDVTVNGPQNRDPAIRLRRRIAPIPACFRGHPSCSVLRLRQEDTHDFLLQQGAVRMTTMPSSNLVQKLPTPRVAVVAEDHELSEACARMLRQEGYAVETAPHSGHALLACFEGRPADVLIAELSMDEGSGPALARRMRRFNPNLRTIFIAKRGAATAAEGVLVRPFTRHELLACLQTEGRGTKAS